MNYDIFLLQETHVSCKEKADCFDSLWPGKCFWSFGTGRSAGVAVLTSPNFSGQISRFVFDSDGRVLSVLIQIGNSSLNIINIYSPNTVSDRKTFFERLHNYFLSSVLIVGGDFNCVDNPIDKFHSSEVHAIDKRSISSFKSAFSLVDVWRKHHPRAISFTWSNSAKTQASRLDRFFISKSLFSAVCSTKIFPCVFSDHDFVDLEFASRLPTHKTGIWKFNCSLLSDTDFKQLIINAIERSKLEVNNFASLGDWWDALKIKLRTISIDFSTRKRRKVNADRSMLTKKLIRAKHDLFSGDQLAAPTVKNLESALSSLISKEAEGAKIRSKVQWLEEGEKPTRFFFRLEQKRAEKNTFESLVDKDGVEKFSQEDLEPILVDFYTSLFSKDTLDMQIQTALIDDLELSLTDSDRERCEGLFTKEEISSALKGLQTGKSPGSDGLPTEFYVVFWDYLCDPLMQVYNERFRLGILADSQREGLLRLIHKKDERNLAKNWRPISLLNTDYKIASKVVTERLKSVMSSIVHYDQTCSVPGRTIFSNLQLIRDVLDMIDKTNETGILVTLDQEKAFDRVDHDFLMRVLSKFGFGPSFCGWVGLFYNNVFSRVICNGQLSSPIFLGRGVRQGCPLSPLLYVLVSEVLSTQIRKCKEIEGFRLPGAGGLQFKISQYADDATNFLKTERSLVRLLEVVCRYEKGSGAKLNTTKSEAMWLGRWRDNGATPFGLKWVTKMRILGVYFSNGLLSVEHDNWKCKLDKLKSVLTLWSSRELSFIGRAMIINVLGASRFWHVAKILAPPVWVVDSYKKITWPFIWKGKMECISRERLCAPVSKGGLNIVNFSVKCSSLRLSNFISLRDNFGTEKWHFLARYFLGRRLIKYDIRFNFACNNIPSSLLPSRHYQLCLDKFTYLYNTYKYLPDDLSCKNIYLLLLCLPSDAPRCAGFWCAVRPINRWASVWRKSRLKLNENKKNDLLWLILHRAVRVRYSLKVWGYIDNDKCAVCGRIENIEHCFLTCPRVVKVWGHFSTHLSRFLNTPFVVSAPTVFYPLSDFQSLPCTSLSNFLIVTILYWIWTSRNLATFRNSVQASQQIIDLIKHDVRSRVLCATADAVKNLWSLQSIFCSVDDNNSITFHL